MVEEEREREDVKVLRILKGNLVSVNPVRYQRGKRKERR